MVTVQHLKNPPLKIARKRPSGEMNVAPALVGVTGLCVPAGRPLVMHADAGADDPASGRHLLQLSACHRRTHVMIFYVMIFYKRLLRHVSDAMLRSTDVLQAKPLTTHLCEFPQLLAWTNAPSAPRTYREVLVAAMMCQPAATPAAALPMETLVVTLADRAARLAALQRASEHVNNVPNDSYPRQTQDKTRQDKTRQDKTRQDKTRQDKTRQDKTRQDKTRQDKTRQDKTRQDKTRQDKTSD